MRTPDDVESIRRHYEGVWQRTASVHRFRRGPVHELSGSFGVLHFPAETPSQHDIYATCCMSVADDPHPIEIHLRAPSASDDHIELLTVIAHYHQTGVRLALGHTVNFGRPWAPRSQCDHGLLSLPYLDGPTLEWMEDGARKRRFLWLIPITRAERDFKAAKGLEALEQRFESTGFNYLDPVRPNVA